MKFLEAGVDYLVEDPTAKYGVLGDCLSHWWPALVVCECSGFAFAGRRSCDRVVRYATEESYC